MENGLGVYRIANCRVRYCACFELAGTGRCRERINGRIAGGSLLCIHDSNHSGSDGITSREIDDNKRHLQFDRIDDGGIDNRGVAVKIVKGRRVLSSVNWGRGCKGAINEDIEMESLIPGRGR